MDTYFYIPCENVGNLIVYFNMVVGPINNLKTGDIEKDGTSFYLDPLQRYGISIFPCFGEDKEDAIKVIKETKNANNKKEINALLKRKNFFLVHGVGNGSLDINERIREVCSMCNGGIEIEEGYKDGVKTRVSKLVLTKKIVDEAYQMQLNNLRKCISIMPSNSFYEQVANEEKPLPRLLNLAYGGVMGTGYTSNRKRVICRDKREDNILVSLCDKIDVLFFKQTPDPYIRMQNSNIRLNTMDFVIWTYMNYGITNFKEIVDDYENISSSYANELANENFNAQKHLRLVRETLNRLVA